MIIKTLYGAETAEFASDYSMEESVEQLAKVVKRSVFNALTSQELVGRVSSSRVSLQRVIPLFGNSFKPFFVGTFLPRGGRVVLTGTFTMHRFAKAFMTLWFGFCILCTLMAMATFLGGNTENALMSLFGAGMLLGGFGFMRLGQWISRGDIAWISRRISEALSCGVEVGSIVKTQGNAHTGRNWKKLLVLGFLALIAFAVVIVTLLTGIIKSTDVYSEALASARSEPEVINAIGEPIKAGLFVSGRIAVSGASGNADLTIPISGPKGKARVHVVASKSAGKWEYSILEVAVDQTDQRINLMPPK